MAQGPPIAGFVIPCLDLLRFLELRLGVFHLPHAQRSALLAAGHFRGVRNRSQPGGLGKKPHDQDPQRWAHPPRTGCYTLAQVSVNLETPCEREGGEGKSNQDDGLTAVAHLPYITTV